MWTAVRLLTVCVLGVGSLFALRSGLPPHPPRLPPPAIHAEADEVAPGNLITKADDPPLVENGKKIVTVEKFHVEVAALDVNDKAPS